MRGYGINTLWWVIKYTNSLSNSTFERSHDMSLGCMWVIKQLHGVHGGGCGIAMYLSRVIGLWWNDTSHDASINPRLWGLQAILLSFSICAAVFLHGWHVVHGYWVEIPRNEQICAVRNDWWHKCCRITHYVRSKRTQPLIMRDMYYSYVSNSLCGFSQATTPLRKQSQIGMLEKTCNKLGVNHQAGDVMVPVCSKSRLHWQWRVLIQ